MNPSRIPELIRQRQEVDYDDRGGTIKEKLLDEIRDNEHEICIIENRLGLLKAQNSNLMNKLARLET